MSLEDKMKEHQVAAFGFSFHTEDEIKEVERKLLQDVTTKDRELDRLRKVRDKVVSLLETLAKQPEKTYVYWPNRSGEISKLLAEINYPDDAPN